MSLITCTSKCKYQQDGYCGLERAGSTGLPCAQDPCVNFMPQQFDLLHVQPLQNGAERFTDVFDPNQL